MTVMTDREALAAVLMDEQGFEQSTVELLRVGRWSDGQHHWTEALETADLILAAGFSRAAVSRAALEETLTQAEGWSKDGYSETSKSYWAGIRDTLRVVLGVTTQVPVMTPDEHVDAAAITILGAQQRATKKAPR